MTYILRALSFAIQIQTYSQSSIILIQCSHHTEEWTVNKQTFKLAALKAIA